MSIPLSFRVIFVTLIGLMQTAGNGLLAMSKERSSLPKVEDFPAGVLSIQGEVRLEGRFLVISQRKSTEPFVYSGNRIQVTEGEAKLELLLGGALNICKASQLTVLKNHSPYLFSLETGGLTFDLPRSRGDTFFTPDFLITTESEPSGPPTSSKGEISLESDGGICVRSLAGNLRIATQNGSHAFSLLPGASVRLSPDEGGSKVVFLKESCACTRYPKLSDAMLSFREHPGRGVFLVKTRTFFRKMLHVLTLGLV
jgi:hypothetical protein